ncbi:MAG: imidazole glycerol phosphate synthase subunit HisH [Acidimicrobiia bacterium]
MTEVVIVPTGTANIASVRSAFRRLGSTTRLARSPRDVSDAGHLVVPGVGSFGAAMTAVDRLQLSQPILDRARAGSPTLAVCVGMQLLCRDSTESPGVLGLGLLDESVTRFGDNVRVPQLGWNTVEANPSSRYLEPGWAYFANSYRLVDAPRGWVSSTADHGGRFIAAIERQSVLALQFHPELSGDWGVSIIDRWLRAS